MSPNFKQVELLCVYGSFLLSINTYIQSRTARRTLAPARLNPQQLQCRASAELPQWNFSDANFQITHYGQVLLTNKNVIGSAADAALATPEEKALVVAMAMQETTRMEVCLPTPGNAQHSPHTHTYSESPEPSLAVILLYGA